MTPKRRKPAQAMHGLKAEIGGTNELFRFYTATSAAASEYVRMAWIRLSREELAEWLSKEALWS